MTKARRYSLIAALALAPVQTAAAQPAAMPTRIGLPAAVVATPSEPRAMLLYGSKTPGSSTDEVWSRNTAGKFVVRNVTRPVLTAVLPASGKANGAAVIVAPGGGFMSLSIDEEGFDVARVLAAHGIAAFVLKYRLSSTPADEAAAGPFMVQQIVAAMRDPAGPWKLAKPEATEDALAALALVRARAGEWRIDPARVGMIGFSAGAMTSLGAALHPAITGRPAFIGYSYGPQTAIDLPADAPPMFDAIAFDDAIFPTVGFPLVAQWLKARRPVEVHAYQTGNHGFGLGRPGTTTTLVMNQFLAWLQMNGFLTPARSK